MIHLLTVEENAQNRQPETRSGSGDKARVIKLCCICQQSFYKVLLALLYSLEAVIRSMDSMYT
jgi:hypothetical protein